ncbi:hypothetical protein AB1L42_02645 [Thalassoglobus sp. JC818]|uniref:hypothetical protein n=1 Tax=Thalassoglobus sp. JC818 TaxID=3232136 RepID=UPI003457CD84
MSRTSIVTITCKNKADHRSLLLTTIKISTFAAQQSSPAVLSLLEKIDGKKIGVTERD